MVVLMFYKKIILIISIIFILSISAVNAVEIAENLKIELNNDNLIVNNSYDSNNQHYKLSVNYSSESLKNAGDFDDVKSVTLIPEKLSTTYGSGKVFKIKALDTATKKPLSNVEINLKVFTGNNYKKVSLRTDLNGFAKFDVSKLKVGKHKIEINVKDTKKFVSKSESSVVKISKAKLSISAPKITNYYKINNNFYLVWLIIFFHFECGAKFYLVLLLSNSF